MKKILTALLILFSLAGHSQSGRFSDIFMISGSGPGVTTNKLYNISGHLFWHGFRVDSIYVTAIDTSIYATKYDLDTLSSKKYKIEIINDSENNLSIPFSLKSTSTIYYNGFVLKDQQWSGIGSKILLLNFVTGKYDYVYVLN